MAKKDVNIVSSMVGKGLQLEYELLKSLLNSHDCYVNGYHYTNIANSTYVRADVNVFLEVLMPNVLSLSRENWLMPNSEWWNSINDRFLPQFTKILAKTRDCERIWKAKLATDRPERVIYTGFEARDVYDPAIEKENKFLHLAGESEFKGTQAVIEAWRLPNWSLKPLPLTVVTRQKRFQDLCVGVEGVTCIADKVSEDELKRLLNSHRFHLLPCRYEGFGHALNEGVMCGGLVITTDAPPMNEFVGVQADWGVRPSRREQRSLATLYDVTASDVCASVMRALASLDRPVELERRSVAARRAALAERDAFRERFLSLMGVLDGRPVAA
jgi:glycosyltransferase involved in cell wall biosynthesis